VSSRSHAVPRARVRLTARAGILAALVVVLGILSIVPLRQFLGQRAQIARLEDDAALVGRANHALEQQVARLHHPDELERLARVCLGMVKPGETAFVAVPKEGQPRPPQC
jgi:cell division protein FtsB